MIVLGLFLCSTFIKCKLFASFIPHLSEEIYFNVYQKLEGDRSLHLSKWPEPALIDENAEKAGEVVKEYISQVRSWKSENKIALNYPLNSLATYSTASNISMIAPSSSIIISTLKYPDSHEFIPKKPNIEEKITKILPVYSKIGPISMFENCFRNVSPTRIYSSNISSETIIRTLPSRHALRIWYGGPVKNTPETNTFVSSTIFTYGPELSQQRQRYLIF